MQWTIRGVGYYEATGLSGIAVCIVRRGRDDWRVYAGDKTAARVIAKTLREAKVRAEKLFG